MPSNETLAIVLLALTLNALGSVLFKVGASENGTSPHAGKIQTSLVFAKNMLGNKRIMLGLLLQMGAIVAWLAFMSRMALSFAFPMSSVSNVSVLLASHFLLHEYISPRRWLGVFVILIGITIIANT
ncbi:MAG TPA: EamA family transporter [Methylophilaceae bacterium]|jgi:drug/metabolite transporter (DMT)-like permease